MIFSNTIVKNGQPFIEQVLRNVEPFVDKMLVTISEKSDDGTLASLLNLKYEFPRKVVIDTENVNNPGELTMVRQKQLDKSKIGDWILFLDDDDWWFPEELEEIKTYLHRDVDGLSVRPWQLTGLNTYDENWKNKYFTKWFKKQKYTHYERPWPRDLIFNGSQMLYWKVNKRVPCISTRFFHLSYIKDHSFRSEGWAKSFSNTSPNPVFLPGEELDHAKQIFLSIK